MRLRLVLPLLLLGPSMANARVGDGDADFRAFLQPSPNYDTIVLPCFFAALLLAIAGLKWCRDRGQKLGVTRAMVVATGSVIYGLALFVGISFLYRLMYDSTILYRPYVWRDLPPIFRPFIFLITRPVPGLFLVLAWFIVQPFPLQYCESRIRPGISPKLRLLPSRLFSLFFCGWIFLSMLRLVFTSM